MMTANGRADTSARPIHLGVLLPERREVELNGTTYSAWVCTNRRYPRRVQAGLDAALNTYLRVAGPLLRLAAPEDPTGPATDEQLSALKEHDLAYQEYLTEAISLLIPDMAVADPEAIEILPTDQAEDLLRSLGYFPEKQEQPEPQKEAGDETTRPLTGSKRRRASRTSTPE